MKRGPAHRTVAAIMRGLWLELVEAVHALDEAPAAFDHAARPGVLKVLLRMA